MNETTSSSEAKPKIDFQKITRDGLWGNNAALVQLLGLCPLLAVSNSVVNALGLGIATVLVLVISNSCVSLIRGQVNDEIRLPVFVLIIASATTCIELIMKAFTFELYEILGIFIPLIVTNCAVLGRADAFASKNNLAASALDGFMIGSGFLLVLLALGALREILGSGTLFADMELLLGSWASVLEIQLAGEQYRGFLFAILPPGAFVLMGLIIAAKNIFDERQKQKQLPTSEPGVQSKRVRVTGHIS